MYRTACVMVLVALCAGLAHSFSWEIVKAVGNRLEFFDINGTILHTENMELSDAIYRITYDPVHNRVLFADLHNIFSFDLTTKKTEFLIKNRYDLLISLAYDPATELLFWVEDEDSQKMYSITLKPESDKNKVNKKHFIMSQKFANYVPDIAVDSCGGFIYYTSYHKIKKVRFNGSDNEDVINNDGYIHSFTIDQQAQKMYFTDTTPSIKSADLNGENIRTISTLYADKLIVAKDSMYWLRYDIQIRKRTIEQLPKNVPLGIDVEPKHFTDTERLWSMAAYWNINDITPQEIQNCDNLKSLLPNNSVSTDVSLLCVHGTKVEGESRCECTQGYSGERCDGSVCHNYCLYGDCSTSADGQPKCSCYAGYSGDRCEVNSCQGYCLNDGLCSLSEEGKPLCRCTGHYEGERCDVPLFQTKCFQAISLLKDMFNTV